MRKLDDHLKHAITSMPAKQKDKLLLRLVAKDEKLVEQLIFQLLEGGTTADERATEVRRQITANLPASGHAYLTPGLLLMDLRHWNARINDHVRTTKDRPGEVALGAFLFAEAFRRHWDMLQRRSRKADTFAPYVVQRAAALVKKAEKLHEDYHLEFRRDLNELLGFIQHYPPAKVEADAVGLPGRWE